MNAESLIGKSSDYLRVSNTRIEIRPFQKNTIWWRFTFTTPGVYDDKLNIYTSLLGNVTETTPKDIVGRLRQAERLGQENQGRTGTGFQVDKLQ